MKWFVTGAGTGVGKTYVTVLLTRALRRQGLRVAALKPICCGERDDAMALHEASGAALSLDEINPLWLREPLAPYPAAKMEEREIDLEKIRAVFKAANEHFENLLVEGAGGWLVPLRKDYFIADLAAEMRLPVVIVARNELGAINHTLLTIESVRGRGCDFAGIILNNMTAPHDAASRTNRNVLEEITRLPVLFEIQKNQRELTLGAA